MKKEIPVLFSTLMVQAILEGRKTQTRRLVKPQPQQTPGTDGFMKLADWISEGKRKVRSGLTMIHTSGPGKGLMFPDCPYGKPGDVLWVRESWSPKYVKGGLEGFRAYYQGVHPWIYKADHPNDKTGCAAHAWKPSIHMPKDACRIWLEVTEVRAERLQEISEADARAEGAKPVDCWYTDGSNQGYSSYAEGFKSLWHSINGEESWNVNPWVWVVSFNVLSTTGKPCI